MRIAADYRCGCGEGPLYDPKRSAVFWTDINTGRMFQFDCATGEHRQIYTGEAVGGFTLEEDGGLVLFRVTDIARLAVESGEVRRLASFVDEGVPRFNDTSAGPGGVVFAGTMGKQNKTGGLFRVDREGDAIRVRELFRGTGCSNGMGWSPDRKRMYWTCSTRNVVYVYDYDVKTGEMSNEREWLRADRATEGTCDGLAVDSAGCAYSARWGGSAIYKYDPNGTLITRIPVPAKNVTSLCFGGEDLKDVYVSTAAAGEEGVSGAGALYVFRNDTAGQMEFRSRLGVS